MTWKVAGIAATIVAACSITTSGQTRSRQAVVFDMVRLSAVVTNAAGAPAAGLDVDDFQLLEDGIEQSIQVFNARQSDHVRGPRRQVGIDAVAPPHCPSGRPRTPPHPSAAGLGADRAVQRPG